MKYKAIIRKGDKNGLLVITVPKKQARLENMEIGDIVNIDIEKE